MILAMGILLFLFTVTIHECAHGYTASLFGDDTAKVHGRLTLNPLKHIDPFWTVLFPLLLFLTSSGRLVMGMARPVPVDFRKVGRTRLGAVLVPFAGPASNFLMAAGAALGHTFWPSPALAFVVWLNVALGLFNLLPVPPLDGFRIVQAFLPGRLSVFLLRYEWVGMVALLLLYMNGTLAAVMMPLVERAGHFLLSTDISGR